LEDVTVDGSDGPGSAVDVGFEEESEEGLPSSARATPMPGPLATAADTPSAKASAPIRPMGVVYRNGRG